MLKVTMSFLFSLFLLLFLFGFVNGLLRTLKTYKDRSAELNRKLDNLEKLED